VDAFDVIVVGGGHAGCEAAAAAARLGRRTALVVFARSQVGRLSCNPAIGGLAKGHLVREIDALGGVMGRVADAARIQFRRLNTRKGLAVQASRAQVDIDRYPAEMHAALAALPNLVEVVGEVTALRTQGGRMTGVSLADGRVLDAPSVVLTTGTFLGGVLHRGEDREAGGRVGDPAASALSRSLREHGLRLGRLKTGTCPRLDARTIRWDLAAEQTDTWPEGRFSHGAPGPLLPQVTCHQVYTTPESHAVIRENLHRSPMVTGSIVGRGPRYCPSIEDKVTRFADRDRHLLYLEPEGLDTPRVYVNGLSTSLPQDAQAEVLAAIPALAGATVLQWGYAVEYDYADPRDLGPDLQHRGIPGLFLAGQVNGTSGYEEAAGQGLIAGLSAALGEVFHVERSEGYLGVLIDDLVQRGVGGEPYRLFTSRAEHRLVLREDNADRRLMPRGRALGLVDDETWARFEARQARAEAAMDALQARALTPDAETQARLVAAGHAPLHRSVSALEWLRRPEVSYGDVERLGWAPTLPPDEGESVETDVKYAGYIALAERRVAEAARLEGAPLPSGLDWTAVGALSWEVRERLREARPRTVGQLARIPGVTPAAVHAVIDLLARPARPVDRHPE
jgi:tRNA uridine 5-carboxymethylaminomethyl modification enzyme